MIQFKLCPGALRLYKKKHSGHRLWVKVTPLVKEGREEGAGPWQEESLDMVEVRSAGPATWPVLETAAMTEDQCHRRVQEQYGIEYKNSANTFLIFEAQLLNPATVVSLTHYHSWSPPLPIKILPTLTHVQAFLVDIYARGPGVQEEEEPEHVGMCYIYPDSFKQSRGRLRQPITSLKFQPIGQLTVDYLVVHPTPGLEMDFSISYRNYWNPHWKGLDVGHRGLGNSYTPGLQ